MNQKQINKYDEDKACRKAVSSLLFMFGTIFLLILGAVIGFKL